MTNEYSYTSPYLKFQLVDEITDKQSSSKFEQMVKILRKQVPVDSQKIGVFTMDGVPLFYVLAYYDNNFIHVLEIHPTKGWDFNAYTDIEKEGLCVAVLVSLAKHCVENKLTLHHFQLQMDADILGKVARRLGTFTRKRGGFMEDNILTLEAYIPIYYYLWDELSLLDKDVHVMGDNYHSRLSLQPNVLYMGEKDYKLYAELMNKDVSSTYAIGVGTQSVQPIHFLLELDNSNKAPVIFALEGLTTKVFREYRKSMIE